MSLDDEIARARRFADTQSQIARDNKARQARNVASLKAAIADALTRLQEYPSWALLTCEKTSRWFGGADRRISDPSGNPYRVVAQQHCWVINNHWNGPKHRRPDIVLTDSGKLAQIPGDHLLTCTVPNTLALDGPLGNADNAFRSSDDENKAGAVDVNIVKRKLADAIVAYERNTR